VTLKAQSQLCIGRSPNKTSGTSSIAVMGLGIFLAALADYPGSTCMDEAVNVPLDAAF